jgi:hypothetical protein
MPSNIIEFPAAPVIKCFRAIAWNGRLYDECSTVPFRRATVNPDPSLFAECQPDEMKSARGLAANYLGSITQSGTTVEQWGWL